MKNSAPTEHFIRLVFSACLLFFAFFSFFSCAADDAEISSASESLILDYENDGQFPSARLAVFIQTKNAVQRADSFSVENLSTGYVWKVNSPEIFEASGRQFAYCTDLKAPADKKIPKGDYKIVYTDAAGNLSEFSFSLSYDDSLLEEKSSEISDKIPGKIENLAVYDESGELIYFGKRKAEWTSASAVKNELKIASSMRECYSSPSNSVICLMPEEFFKKN